MSIPSKKEIVSQRSCKFFLWHMIASILSSQKRSCSLPVVNCAFSHTIKDSLVHVMEGLPFIRWNCLNLLLHLVMSCMGHRRCPSDELDVHGYTSWYDKGVFAFYYQMLFLGYAEEKRCTALEKGSKRICQTSYLFFTYARATHYKMDSKEKAAGQMTFSAVLDPAKVAHVISS